jgi:Protein of unknown function (DUF1203)
VQPLRFSALSPEIVDDARSSALASGRAVVPDGDGSPFPVRCCLSDEHAADDVLLLSVQVPAADSPYTARSPVYVHRSPCPGREPSAAVPEILRSRRLSLRGYDPRHMITGSAVVEGHDVERQAAALLDDERTAYVFAHFAGPGCYACRIDRG